jgi:hypothetical protein
MTYTLPWMKFNRRWRRILWRVNGVSGTYKTWVTSTVITLAGMRMLVGSAGPTDTRACAARAGSRAARHAAGHDGGAASAAHDTTDIAHPAARPVSPQTASTSRRTGRTRAGSTPRSSTTPSTGARALGCPVLSWQR